MFWNTNNASPSKFTQDILEELLKPRFTDSNKEDGQQNQLNTFSNFLLTSIPMLKPKD
jgi:hypothetical protein